MNEMVSVDEFFPSDERVRAQAATVAFGLLAAIADPQGATKRLTDLTKAAAKHEAARAVAEKLMAEVDHKMAAAEAASTSLAQRTKEYQTWVDSTEKAYRAREDRIRTSEESQTAREAKLVSEEADLSRRRQAHEQRVTNLKESLA
jgi:hypothetical protein